MAPKPDSTILEQQKTKYTYLSEFYQLQEAIRRDDGVVNLSFQCMKCLPQKVYRKTTSQAGTSNLKNHVAKLHTCVLSKYNALKSTEKRFFEEVESTSQDETVSKKQALASPAQMFLTENQKPSHKESFHVQFKTTLLRTTSHSRLLEIHPFANL